MDPFRSRPQVRVQGSLDGLLVVPLGECVRSQQESGLL